MATTTASEQQKLDIKNYVYKSKVKWISIWHITVLPGLLHCSRIRR